MFSFNKKLKTRLEALELEKTRLELEKSSLAAELEAYKELSNTVKIYAGNYGVWKAQSEFRSIVESYDAPLKNPQHFAYIDTYFDKVTNACSKLAKTLNIPQSHPISPERGQVFSNEFLEIIVERQPEIAEIKKRIKEK